MNRTSGPEATSPLASAMGAPRIAVVYSVGAQTRGQRELVFDGPDLCAITDRGRLRARNEDAICISPDGRVIAVGDGVGALRAGHVASALATRVAVQSLCQQGARHGDAHSVAKAASAAMGRANASAIEHARRDDDCAGMCCALLSACICDDLLVTAHAGDVRAYLWRPHRLRQLTKDHSLAAALVAASLMNSEAADRHSSRGRLLRAIGMHENVEAEVSVVGLQAGDKVLVCSDGLWGMVPDAVIAESMSSSGSPHQIASALVELAYHHGGRDNISVVVYEHRSEMSAPFRGRSGERTGCRGADSSGCTSNFVSPNIPIGSPRSRIGRLSTY